MKKEKTILFEDYVKMCRKAAHYYSSNYNMEYDEMEGQAFLVYVEALTRWKPETASFSTFLTWRLKTLGDYCLSQKRVSRENVEDDVTEFELLSPETLPGIADILVAAATAISKDAVEVLAWILHRQWEGKRMNKPTVAKARNVFLSKKGWMAQRVDSAWEEVGNFWNSGMIAGSL